MQSFVAQALRRRQRRRRGRRGRRRGGRGAAGGRGRRLGRPPELFVERVDVLQVLEQAHLLAVADESSRCRRLVVCDERVSEFRV